jgi:hypothetical protein
MLLTDSLALLVRIRGAHPRLIFGTLLLRHQFAAIDLVLRLCLKPVLSALVILRQRQAGMQGQGTRQGGNCQSSFHHFRLRIDVDLLAGIGEFELTGLLNPAVRRRSAFAGRQLAACRAANAELSRNLI